VEREVLVFHDICGKNGEIRVSWEKEEMVVLPLKPGFSVSYSAQNPYDQLMNRMIQNGSNFIELNEKMELPWRE
jgi:hypothetical protein